MNIWEKLSQADIKDKEKFRKIFSNTVNGIRFRKFSIETGEVEKEDYFIVTEENRMNAYFINIVPKEVYGLFKEMQASAPNEFLGSRENAAAFSWPRKFLQEFSLVSVLAGKFNGKDVRVSCFGMPCGNLGKSLFKYS